MTGSDVYETLNNMLHLAIAAEAGESAAAVAAIRRLCAARGIQVNDLYLFDRAKDWKGDLLRRVEDQQRIIEKLRADKITLMRKRKKPKPRRERKLLFLQIEVVEAERLLAILEPNSRQRLNLTARLLGISPDTVRKRILKGRVKQSELDRLNEEVRRLEPGPGQPIAPAAEQDWAMRLA